MRIIHSRRNFLGNAALCAVALPFVKSLNGLAQANPKRLVLLFTGCGQHWPSWARRNAPGTNPTTDFTLLKSLEPLQSYKNDLVVLDGVDMPSFDLSPTETTNHGKGMGIAWTGTPLKPSANRGTPQGPSVDQFIAARKPQGTRFHTLELGGDVNDTSVYGRMIYKPDLTPVPPELDPANVYTRVFQGLAGSTPGEAIKPVRSRTPVLDFVLQDICRLRKELGAQDRVLLESHCESFRDLERSMTTPTQSLERACTPPNGIVSRPKGDLYFRERIANHTRLLVAALACGQTNIISFVISQAHGGGKYDWVGATDYCHDHSHYNFGDRTIDTWNSIANWNASQVAELLRQLKAIPEGSGTMLDNTLVVWGTEINDGEHHGPNRMPFLIMGGKNMGIKTGRYLNFDHAPHNNMHVTICNAMGVNVDTFGWREHCTGPLSGLT